MPRLLHGTLTVELIVLQAKLTHLSTRTDEDIAIFDLTSNDEDGISLLMESHSEHLKCIFRRIEEDLYGRFVSFFHQTCIRIFHKTHLLIQRGVTCVKVVDDLDFEVVLELEIRALDSLDNTLHVVHIRHLASLFSEVSKN